MWSVQYLTDDLMGKGTVGELKFVCSHGDRLGSLTAACAVRPSLVSTGALMGIDSTHVLFISIGQTKHVGNSAAARGHRPFLTHSSSTLEA